MLRIMLFATGTVKEAYLAAGIAEYKKRIAAYADFEEVIFREERIANEGDAACVCRALEAEGERILARLPKDAYRVALCVEGKQYDSVALADHLTRACAKSGKICFVLGSSHGLCERVKAACDLRLSVSALTFPHQLMRLLLTEVLYRTLTIRAGGHYHK